MPIASSSNQIARRIRSAGAARRRAGRFRSRVALRPHRPLRRVRAGDIVWPGGEGLEIGIIAGTLDDVVAVVQRDADESLRRVVSYLDEGPNSALIIGPRGRTLASLIADAEIAPGIVAVIADAGSERAIVRGAVESLLGRNFRIEWHPAEAA